MVKLVEVFYANKYCTGEAKKKSRKARNLLSLQIFIAKSFIFLFFLYFSHPFDVQETLFLLLV
jgi:hypothetical protein